MISIAKSNELYDLVIELDGIVGVAPNVQAGLIAAEIERYQRLGIRRERRLHAINLSSQLSIAK